MNRNEKSLIKYLKWVGAQQYCWEPANEAKGLPKLMYWGFTQCNYGSEYTGCDGVHADNFCMEQCRNCQFKSEGLYYEYRIDLDRLTREEVNNYIDYLNSLIARIEEGEL